MHRNNKLMLSLSTSGTPHSSFLVIGYVYMYIPFQYYRYSNTWTFLYPFNDVMSLVAIDTVDGLSLEHLRVAAYCVLQGELGEVLRSHPEERESGGGLSYSLVWQHWNDHNQCLIRW